MKSPRLLGLRERLLGASLIALLSGSLIVEAHAQGTINLSWDNCSVSASNLKTFACNTNTGAPFPLIASFVPPGGVTELIGFEGFLTIQSGTTSLPDWWKHGAGQCRGTAGLSVSADFTAGPFD